MKSIMDMINEGNEAVREEAQLAVSAFVDGPDTRRAFLAAYDDLSTKPTEMLVAELEAGDSPLLRAIVATRQLRLAQITRLLEHRTLSRYVPGLYQIVVEQEPQRLAEHAQLAHARPASE